MQIFWNRVLLLLWLCLYESTNHQPISKNCCCFLRGQHSSVSCCQWCCHPSTLYPGSNLSNHHDNINHMSNGRDFPNTNSVLLRLDLAEGYAKHAFPRIDDPIPIPLFCTSRLKVCEGRNPRHRQGMTLICAWRRHDRVIAPASHSYQRSFPSKCFSTPKKMNFWQKMKTVFSQKTSELRHASPRQCLSNSMELRTFFAGTSGALPADVGFRIRWYESRL